MDNVEDLLSRALAREIPAKLGRYPEMSILIWNVFYAGNYKATKLFNSLKKQIEKVHSYSGFSFIEKNNSKCLVSLVLHKGINNMESVDILEIKLLRDKNTNEVKSCKVKMLQNIETFDDLRKFALDYIEKYKEKSYEKSLEFCNELQYHHLTLEDFRKLKEKYEKLTYTERDYIYELEFKDKTE